MANLLMVNLHKEMSKRRLAPVYTKEASKMVCFKVMESTLGLLMKLNITKMEYSRIVFRNLAQPKLCSMEVFTRGT